MVYKIFTTRWEYELVGDPHKMAIVISKMWITMGEHIKYWVYKSKMTVVKCVTLGASSFIKNPQGVESSNFVGGFLIN